jgi:hypothetical protein
VSAYVSFTFSMTQPIRKLFWFNTIHAHSPSTQILLCALTQSHTYLIDFVCKLHSDRSRIPEASSTVYCVECVLHAVWFLICCSFCRCCKSTVITSHPRSTSIFASVGWRRTTKFVEFSVCCFDLEEEEEEKCLYFFSTVSNVPRFFCFVVVFVTTPLCTLNKTKKKN